MENTAKNIGQPLPIPPPAPQHDWVFEIAESARKAEDSFQNFISENPVRSFAIAIGLGFALNLVMRNIPPRREQL